MMGLLLLIGLVVTNAIVLISFVQQLQDQGMTVRESLIEGGLVRLRPILMTAVTTGAALIPLAVFVGDEGGLGNSGYWWASEFDFFNVTCYSNNL